MYVEDLDYSYRTVGNKYKLYHIPSSQLWHKIGASNGKEISEFSSYWYYRNAIKFILRRFKNIKKITALSYVILKIPFLLLKWIYNDPKIIKPMLKGYLNGFNRSN
jgi:GT2 family glycosyltransferase